MRLFLHLFVEMLATRKGQQRLSGCRNTLSCTLKLLFCSALLSRSEQPRSHTIGFHQAGQVLTGIFVVITAPKGPKVPTFRAFLDFLTVKMLVLND